MRVFRIAQEDVDQHLVLGNESEVKDFLEMQDEGEEFIIKIDQMPEDEYFNLPEFKGF